MSDTRPSRRITGIGTVLTFVYGVMALAATGRSFVQIASRFEHAPIPYLLSAAAAVVYLPATVGLLLPTSPAWYRVAGVGVPIEPGGALVIGALSWAVPDVFHADQTVWSLYGQGYVWVPLVLPFVGIWYLTAQRARVRELAR